ncbi:thioesterase [Corynebacterium sp. zg-331]|nr:thioesterase [Corynebacterium sp. zg-331]
MMGFDAASRILVPVPGSVAGPASRPTIVVFPHAGGSPRQYARWGRIAGPQVRVLGVTYPGRDYRLGDAHPETMRDLAAEIAAVLGVASFPIVLAGHSLGAVLAYETLLAWQRAGGGGGAVLVVSGQVSPDRAGGGAMHVGADSGIVEELSRNDPDTARALADPELAALYLPAIREDYHLIETYIPPPWANAATQSTIIIVKRCADKELTAASATGWRRLSPDVLGPVIVPGDHMHHIHRPELAQMCCGGVLRTAAARSHQRKE